MPDLVCPFCAKIDCTSEYNLKRHVAACSKRFTAYDDDESVNESDKKIPRFASLKNDEDYESDNNNHMPMEEDDDAYIENFNSDNERDSNVGIIGDHQSGRLCGEKIIFYVRIDRLTMYISYITI